MIINTTTTVFIHHTTVHCVSLRSIHFIIFNDYELHYCWPYCIGCSCPLLFIVICCCCCCCGVCFFLSSSFFFHHSSYHPPLLYYYYLLTVCSTKNIQPTLASVITEHTCNYKFKSFRARVNNVT